VSWFTPICFISLWSAYLIAFYGFLRKSNILPPPQHTFNHNKHISRKSFTFTSDGNLLLTLTWSKTNQYGERCVILPFRQMPGSILCPVAAFKHMLSLIPAPSHSPEFVIPTSSGLLSITHTIFVNHLRKFIHLRGYQSHRYSGHSFRKGGCTFAASCGVPAELLKVHGDWRSSAYESYLCMPLVQRHKVAAQMAKSISQCGL